MIQILKSAILDKGEDFHTYMGKVFLSLDNEQLKYNWLITNCECYPQDEKLYALFYQDYFRWGTYWNYQKRGLSVYLGCVEHTPIK